MKNEKEEIKKLFNSLMWKCVETNLFFCYMPSGGILEVSDLRFGEHIQLFKDTLTIQGLHKAHKRVNEHTDYKKLRVNK